MGSERDETYTILVKGKPLASVKADLIHAFLSVSLTSEIFILATPDRCTDLAFDASCVASFIDSVLVPCCCTSPDEKKKKSPPRDQIADLNHSVASPMSFKVEYRRGSTGPAMFQRHVRFNVDIAAIGQHENKGDRCADVDILYAVTFALIAGESSLLCHQVALGATNCRIDSVRKSPSIPASLRADSGSSVQSAASACFAESLSQICFVGNQRERKLRLRRLGQTFTARIVGCSDR